MDIHSMMQQRLPSLGVPMRAACWALNGINEAEQQGSRRERAYQNEKVTPTS